MYFSEPFKISSSPKGIAVQQDLRWLTSPALRFLCRVIASKVPMTSVVHHRSAERSRSMKSQRAGIAYYIWRLQSQTVLCIISESQAVAMAADSANETNAYVANTVAVYGYAVDRNGKRQRRIQQTRPTPMSPTPLRCTDN